MAKSCFIKRPRGIWANYLAMVGGGMKYDTLVVKGIYTQVNGKNVIPPYPHNLRGYPDYPNTARRVYRPTVAW